MRISRQQSKFRSKASHLNSLFEARAQKREEDAGDGHVVSWLGETCVFTSGVHRHAPWNITDGHLVALWDNRRN